MPKPTRGIYPFVPLKFERLASVEQLHRAAEFETRLKPRRTVRHFTSDAVPLELIETAICIAARAPSGANQQPWHFVVVSNPDIKRQIREAAEAEERENPEESACLGGDLVSRRLNYFTASKLTASSTSRA